MTYPVYICGDHEQYTSLPTGVKVCPFIGGAAPITVLGLPEWPAQFTAQHVQSLCTAFVPVGWDGPVMWDDEGREFARMKNAWGAEQRSGEQKFERLLDLARKSRGKAIHCIYNGAPHLFPPAHPDPWALAAWSASRLVDLVDEPNTGVMMSVYPPGWNDKWSEQINLDEIERYAMNCATIAATQAFEFKRPWYAVVSQRIAGEYAILSPYVIHRQVAGVLGAKTLHGEPYPPSGFILWEAERYQVSRDTGGSVTSDEVVKQASANRAAALDALVEACA